MEKHKTKPVDGNTPTFKDLHDTVGFGHGSCLKRIKGSDWLVEINDYKAENLKFYKRESVDGDFLKRLELYFNGPNTMTVYAYRAYSRDPVSEKSMPADTCIRSADWTLSLFCKYETEHECMEAVLQYAEALCTGKQPE